jgi:hypothetical protein
MSRMTEDHEVFYRATVDQHRDRRATIEAPAIDDLFPGEPARTAGNPPGARVKRPARLATSRR